MTFAVLGPLLACLAGWAAYLLNEALQGGASESLQAPFESLLFVLMFWLPICVCAVGGDWLGCRCL